MPTITARLPATGTCLAILLISAFIKRARKVNTNLDDSSWPRCRDDVGYRDWRRRRLGIHRCWMWSVSKGVCENISPFPTWNLRAYLSNPYLVIVVHQLLFLQTDAPKHSNVFQLSILMTSQSEVVQMRDHRFLECTANKGEITG
jgi:hypothetical protein